MTDTFLSYSSKDRDRVRHVHDGLVAAGYSVFWDLQTPHGENWNEWIKGKLAESRLALVLWSKNSCASPNVHHEAAIAQEGGKLLPALLEPLKIADFPMGFYAVQCAQLERFAGEAGHDGFDALLTSIADRLGGRTTQADAENAELADLRRRAQAGEAAAQVDLGYRLSEGTGGVEQDEREAVRLYRLAAEQRDAGGQTFLGWMYEEGRGVNQDDREAVRLYRLAVEQGHALAQSCLGLMYEQGRGVKQDDREAVRLFRLAAEQGEALAHTNLGWMYEDGRLVNIDGEAVRLDRLAAEQGVAIAQAYLGRMYETGRGVEQDDREAVRLFRLVAEKGVAGAQNNLGDMYERGRGVAKDLHEAKRFFRLAAAQGEELAQKALRRLGERV